MKIKTVFTKKNMLIWLLPFLVFLSFVLWAPISITNDSMQYAYMHIRRDPLYCLFLWVLRFFRDIKEFGTYAASGNVKLYFGAEDDSYYRVAVWLQNIFAFTSVTTLVNTINRIYFEPFFDKLLESSQDNQFKRRMGLIQSICTVIIVSLALAPHLITPIVAQTGLVLSNSIMSEAITLPLFYFLLANLILMMESEKNLDKYSWISLLLAWLLSLARGQMMVMLIVWLIVKIIGIIRRKLQGVATYIVILLVAVGVAFGSRSVLVSSYNAIFNNHYMGTTFGGVSILTNVLYASDEDAGQYIEDSEARRFYEESEKLVIENQFTYKYSGPGLLNRGAHLEAIHDRIKFQCIDECWRPIHDEESKLLKDDYELETQEQDRLAAIIYKSLLPHCFGTWLYDYIALCTYGFIRTVAIVHPVLNIYALMVYVFIIAFALRGVVTVVKRWKSNQRANEQTRFDLKLVRLSFFTLLVVCANVCGTATVIMCLSRYMIYVLPLIYVVLLLDILVLVFKNKLTQ